MSLPDLFNNASFVWFLVGLVFALLELVVPGVFIIFFAFGAWLISLLGFFGDIDIAVQIILFVIASVSGLVFLRKKLKSRFFHEKKNDSVLEDDEFIGQKVTVTEEILPAQNGKVEFKGAKWSAKSACNIKAGSVVEIIGQESICLIVKPL
jgi:membrane protein implicated in regulation of membrane protease activity